MDHSYFDLIFDCKLSCYPFQSGNCNRLGMERVKYVQVKRHMKRDGRGVRECSPFATYA